MPSGPRLSLVACLLVASVTACTDVPPAPTPTPTPMPSPRPPDNSSPGPSPTLPGPPTASPDPPPTPTETPTAEPTAEIELEWVMGSDAGGFSDFDVISDATVVGSALVAVGSHDDGSAFSDAAAWFSLDGSMWELAERVPAARQAQMEAVTAGPTGLVAVGFRHDGSQLAPAVWNSQDGLNWRFVSDPDLDRGQMSAVAANALGYVAVGFDPETEEGLAWQSRDGQDWGPAISVPTFEVQPSVNGILALGDTFVAYGFTQLNRRAALWTSLDGLEWQPVADFPTGPDSSVNAVASSGTRLVAVGASYLDEGTAPLAWVSEDGQQWQRSLDLTQPEPGQMLSAVPLGSGFIAVGDMGDGERADFRAAVWLSEDGRGWHRAPGDETFERARMSEILRAGPGLVALGEVADDPAVELFRPVAWVGTTR